MIQTFLLKDTRNRISESGLLNKFGKFIGENCSTSPRFFTSLLLAKTDNQWIDLALTNTNRAAPEIVKRGLSLMRDSQLNASVRGKLFIWLCKVEILEDSTT